MSCFFDTNVLVYVFDRAEPRKQAAAQELVTEHMTARDMVLSTQVLQELYVTLTRKKRLGAADALEVVTTFAQERIVPAKAGLGWFCLQLIAHGDGREPDRALDGEAAIRGYLANEESTAAALEGRS